MKNSSQSKESAGNHKELQRLNGLFMPKFYGDIICSICGRMLFDPI